ncbi:MAG: thioesterase domain-containing protein [Fischerella sp. CENA71]|nr:thioesterase domain-containing protein [Fischerella sp. CENA71]
MPWIRLLNVYLANKLPEYMVPSRFVLLDAFPLMANGKIDQKALLKLRDTSLTNSFEYTIPRNYIGFELTRIWEKLLKVSPIGIHDNFFRLGGHSLLAIRMVAEIQKAFPGNQSINITHVFKQPTIAGLTKLLTTQPTVSQPDLLLPIQIINGSQKSLFLVHPGEGLAFTYKVLSGYLENYTIYGINNPRFGDLTNPFKSVQEMASSYIESVFSVQKEGPYYLGGWSFGGVVAFEMARQIKERGHHVDLVILIDSYNFSAFSLQTAKSEEIEYFLSEQGLDPTTEEGKKLQFELENNGKLSINYCPKVYEGRVILFKAKNPDPQFLNISVDLQNGWKVCTGSKLEVYTLPGRHADMFEQQNLGNLLEGIRKVLNIEENF